MMKNTLTRCLHHLVPSLSMLTLLAGCSSLQIDVDVYKGPLANEREIQIRQYVSLAAVAKVRIQNLQCQAFEDKHPTDIQTEISCKRKELNKLLGQKDAQAGSSCEQNVQSKLSSNPFASYAKEELNEEIRKLESHLHAQEFLSDVLALYLDKESEDSTKIGNEQQKYKAPCAIDASDLATEATMLALKKRTNGSSDNKKKLTPSENTNAPNESNNSFDYGLDTLSQEVSNALDNSITSNSKNKKLQEVNKKVERLNNAMIFFAQKLLLTANTDLLYKSLGVSYSNKMKDGISALQSLGNTILVQSNDLQRQLTRQQLLLSHASSERNAVSNAFHLAPSLAFDHIVQTIEQRRQAAPSQAAATNSADAKIKERQQFAQELGKFIQQEKDIKNYQNGIAGMLAAYRTIVGEPPKSLLPEHTGDIETAEKDRKEIAKFYPNLALGEDDKASGLKPLLNWLTVEQASSTVLAPQRQLRLQAAADYLDKEKQGLNSAIGNPATRDKILISIKSKLNDAIFLAKNQVKFNATQIKPIKEKIAKLTKQIEKLDASSKMAAEALSNEQTADAKRQAILPVLQSLRSAILQQADNNQLNGVTAITTLLKLNLKAKLAELKTAVTVGKPTQAELAIALALEAISDLPQLEIAPCIDDADKDNDNEKNKTKKKKNANCDEDAINVLDNQIAALRAQRVHAIASGNPAAANNYLTAINVAYEQRASLIFLRPAGDYLRSVYSANALQTDAQKNHRNMLFDWIANISPDKESVSRIKPSELFYNGPNGKEELEKLYWQNVNKVTLSGGGKANYVLAKDDVGNWYVKSYGSDPESIIKSATSLALFNSGKAFNTNLLRRNDLQQQFDKSDNTAERQQLKGELDKINSGDGIGLTKVHARYAKRYKDDTLAHASAVLGTLTSIAEKVANAVNDPSNNPGKCIWDEFKKDLTALDKDFLNPARDELKSLLATGKDSKDSKTTEAEEAKTLIAIEGNLQKSLINLQLYAGQVRRTLADSNVSKCEDTERFATADKAKKVVQLQVMSIATERKKIIERFEDALDNLSQIAADN